MVQPPELLLEVVRGDAGAELPSDEVSVRILDAALEEFTSFGLRRATVEDITRRARVGRMTLHRRYPTKQALIGAVFLREIGRVLGELDAVMARHDRVVDRLVDGLAVGIQAVHAHPLFSRLLETDREAVLPYLTLDAGPLMIASATYMAQQLPDDRPVDERLRAGELLIRVSHSILLTPVAGADLRELDVLRAYLRAPVAAIIGAAAE